MFQFHLDLKSGDIFVAGQLRGDQCVAFYFRGGWWVCMAEDVREVFGVFEGE